MEVNAFVHKFSHPEERKKYLEMLKIGSAFDMRPRALFHYYGPDLIAYKKRFLSNPQVNYFLRLFSAYLTTHLEDDCPESWEECGPEFWEELITVYYPYYMKITIEQNQTEIFFTQLLKFAHWLDKRTGCSCYEIVKKCTEENWSELTSVESLLNDLLLYTFPNLYEEGWNTRAALEEITEQLRMCSSTVESLFEVRQVTETMIVLYDIAGDRTYQINNISKHMSPGILIFGEIGRKARELYWILFFTQTVYPPKAKQYIVVGG
ncbi:hypothetical protein GCM10008986_14080 [Salinibacillus aidingensis]|uniref:Uncharacterized protein n=1 Tax=Salinibacillus aidingensis TaxID=237684 RepID=A0ABP3KYE4_9BACI